MSHHHLPKNERRETNEKKEARPFGNVNFALQNQFFFSLAVDKNHDIFFKVLFYAFFHRPFNIPGLMISGPKFGLKIVLWLSRLN